MNINQDDPKGALDLLQFRECSVADFSEISLYHINSSMDRDDTWGSMNSPVIIL